MYADDISLLSSSKLLLSCLHKWCIKWKVYTNANKSVWSSNINIWLDRHLKVELCDNALAKSRSRAFTTLINKYNVNQIFNHDISTYLFNTCISSIMFYGNEACRYNNCIYFKVTWDDSLSVDRHVFMVRFWKRLIINMKPVRLTKRFFFRGTSF